MTKQLVCCILLWAALGQAALAGEKDITGLWVTSMYGNAVECHLEQRGQFLYGVAQVTTRSGERNTYHLGGLIANGEVRASHGSGHGFVGKLEGENRIAGQFTFKDGPTIGMQAERTVCGLTVPGGLQWPDGFGPSK